jgi:hypothetical protein
MKPLTMTALATVLVGTMGALTLVPTANADDPAAPAASSQAPATTADNPAPDETNSPRNDGTTARGGMMGRWGMMGHWGRPGGMMDQRGGPGGWHRMGGGRNLLDMACGDRGAEALEIAFVHIKYAVKPDATQAPLLDALRTAALADQKNFATACPSTMSQNGGKPGGTNLLDRLQARQTMENAKAAALNDVVPKFKAFYDSLTAEQKSTFDSGLGAAHFGFGGMGPHQGWRGTPNQMHRMGPMNRPGPSTPDTMPSMRDTTQPATPDTAPPSSPAGSDQGSSNTQS